MLIQNSMLQIGKRPNGFVFPNNNYSEYAFYWQPGRVDKVSKQALSDGTVDDGYLNTYGAYTVLNSFSNDISDDYWATSGSPLLTANTFLATVQYSFFNKAISTTAGTMYTFSFYAYVENGGRLTGFRVRHADSADGNYTDTDLTYTRTRYSFTVLGEASSDVVLFGLMDLNTSDWSKVYIDTINVTETAYAMPPAENNEAGELSVPYTYADSTQGPKFQMTPDEIGAFTGPIESGPYLGDE